ncbi:MAG: response regulator [Bacteroidetes bacterium]|nr:response regulator [Bacteroidota bacterium]
MTDEKRPLIFIVDDDPMYHKLISHNLRAENFDNVMVFDSGEDCINNLDKKPDVIILDYEMKGINGIQTLKKIKEYNKDIKVILCSSQEEMDVVFDSLKFGASNYVRKNEFAYNKIKFLMKNILN